jgi:hypothetical protein
LQELDLQRANEEALGELYQVTLPSVVTLRLGTLPRTGPGSFQGSLRGFPGLRRLEYTLRDGHLICIPTLERTTVTLATTLPHNFAPDLEGLSSLRSLELNVVAGLGRRATEPVFAAMARLELEQVALSNVPFPSDPVCAPSLVSFKGSFDDFADMAPGLFPSCPRLEHLVLDLDYQRGDHWNRRRESLFATDVLRDGLQGWLLALTSLKQLELRGDGTERVVVQDLPRGLEVLSLTGLSRLVCGPEDPWAVLQTFPRLARLHVSTWELTNGEVLERERRKARVLRDTAVVLRPRGGEARAC